MSKKNRKSVLGLALGTLVLGLLVGLLTVGTVAADPTPGVHIQIPRIDNGDVLGTGDWETWIQVQNVGDDATGAIFLGWGDYSGLCPTNDPGIIVHYCQLIRENSIWTLRTQIAEEVKSGIIYTVRADAFQEACSTAELTEGNTNMWREWLKEWQFGTGMDITKDPAVPMTWGDPVGAQGEDVAVTVTRYGPNDYGTFISSTYTGISEEMEGEDSPYEYYAPYVMKGYNGLDTELTIQNSGTLCTSVWINYLEQGNCSVLYKQHIEQLAPGEAIRVRVPCNTGQIPCFWLGSAHIAAEQPLGIVVDETSFDEPCVGVDRGTLLTHRARPLKEKRGDEWILDTKVYADLIFREWSGWDASIQVQNLSRTGQHTFVTVDFMDNSGDEILFLADWVCATGSTTFYLPIVNNLGYEYVGAAEIQSHDQIDYPGGETPAQPIFAVVDLKKPDDPRTPEMDAQGGSYNAHPESQKEFVTEVALPFMTKDAQDMYTPWTSMIAIRNNSNCNKIKPKLYFRDETGTLMCQLDSPWLQPKHLKMIDLNNIGCLYSGYIGSATVVVEQVEQLCDVDPQDGVVDQEPVMPSVIVVEKGILGLPYGGGGGDATALADTWGDVTNIYEGIPYKYEYWDCNVEICGQVIDKLTLDPIKQASIYTVERIDAGPFTVSGTAYVTDTCKTDLTGLPRVAGADVELRRRDGAAWELEDATFTDGAGEFEFVDGLELGETYQLRLFLEVNGNPVAYTSNPFPAPGVELCDVELNFRIETNGGGLNYSTGTWCPEDVAECFVDRFHTTTDSTGHYCFTYGDESDEIKTAEPQDITVKALHLPDYEDDGINSEVTLPDVACDDQVAYFELVSLCNTVTVSGTVYDAETGLPLDDAWVEITVGAEVKNATTANGGKYSVTDVPFDPDETIKVCAGKIKDGVVEYTPHCLTTYIPECDGEAVVDFELHTEPRKQIKLYYGNGGLNPDDGIANDDPDEYYDLKARYENAGYIVTYDDAWPADPDLEEYKLIVLIMPGYDNDNVATNGFNVSQAAQLGLFVHGGGRLVLLVDNEAQANSLNDDYDVPNKLLADLTIGITVTNNASTDDTYDNVIDAVAETPYDNEFEPQHLEGNDCQELSLFDGAFDMYESDPNDHFPVIAADKVGFPNNDPDEDTSTGWDVIVVSDAEILSDFFQGAGWPEDVEFADNLIAYPQGP